MSIVILDYGIGNVKSIINAFENQGEKIILTRDKKIILESHALILPGVGAFSHGMKNLKKYNLIEIIKDFVESGKPLLGICLGMQMLMEESEEFGLNKGLGLVKGSVVKMPIKASNKVKLPHISWNSLKNNGLNWDNTILNEIEENSSMYFVHTFVACPKNKNEILSYSTYHDINFCSALKKDNIYGCQFHPEKSGKIGLRIIKNFINISKKQK